MPNRLKNWTFNNVENFLRNNNFTLHHTNGSHYYYIGNNQKLVCVPFHGSKIIKPRTIKGIISQSGISQEKWFNPKK